jgi:hypothetical protein
VRCKSVNCLFDNSSVLAFINFVSISLSFLIPLFEKEGLGEI